MDDHVLIPNLDWHRPIDMERKEIRLITIEPAQTNDGSDIVRLHLDHFPLDDSHFTEAWRDWATLRNTSEVSESRWEWREMTAGTAQNPTRSSTFSLEKAASRNVSQENLTPFRYSWGDYLALSYTWGHLLETSEVILNGKRVRVGKNLEAALRAIRALEMWRSDFKLWVDALCINQFNNFERAEQVQRMKDIYSSALDVIVYIGQGSTDVHTAFDFIDRLTGIWGNSLERQEQLIAKVLVDFPSSIGLMISEIGHMHYWDRIWVTQELANGTMKMPVICGNRTVLWEDLYNTILTEYPPLWYAVSGSPDLPTRLPPHMRQCSSYFMKIQQLGMVRREEDAHNTSELFAFSRFKGASNPRDKIFGLLGLMTPKLARTVHVSYDDDVEHIYRSFAKSWISELQDLNLLGECEYQDVPSWTPHWDRTVFRRIMRPYGTPWRASGNLNAQTRFVDNDTKMVAKGILLDEVDGMTPALKMSDGGQIPPKGPVEVIDNNNIAYFNDLLPIEADKTYPSSTNANAYGDDKGASDALWRTLCSNVTLQDEVPDANLAPLLAKMLLEDDEWSDWRSKSESFTFAGRTTREHLLLWKDAPSDISDQYRAYWQRVRFNLWRRRLFTTKTGYIGFAEEPIRPGDVVAVLLGCMFPILLRPYGQDQEEYRVVSTCYVHGAREGQIAEAYGKGEMSAQDFTIV